jgi:hypothetical protein
MRAGLLLLRSNLVSLLDICGFDDVRLIRFPAYAPTLK